MCLYSRLIRNKKYEPNKKNGGFPPAVIDNRTKIVPIGCGNCIECRKQKSREWMVRLLEDIKTNRFGKFITLTFSNESIAHLIPQCNGKTGYELDNEIATRSVRLFLERWRKKFGKSLRHWLVTELGHEGTENIHLHGILWTNINPEIIEKIWSYGFVWIGRGEKKTNYVNAQTINYITKYITKIDLKHKYYKSLVLTSPGIGANYLNNTNSIFNKFNHENTIETYKTSNGYEIPLPIYWRNKIYSDEEKNYLWIYKLNKNERYICGEVIKADDIDSYYSLLDWHRDRNQRLGYGSTLINWDREQYEIQQRQINYETRLRNYKLNQHKG